jgi:uncharacterized protein YjbI with pentapeptide repeats
MWNSAKHHVGTGTDRARALMRVVSGVAIVIALIVLILSCVILVPKYLVANDSGHAKLSSSDLAKARNDVRGTLLQGIGGIVLLGGAYLTWQSSRRQRELDRQGQITERFTRAIDQLGSDKLDVRMGGIYALGRVNKDSHEDQETIMEVLAAFVRSRAAWKSNDPTAPSSQIDRLPLLAIRNGDIQAALAVLAKQGPRASSSTPLIMLNVDLRNAMLNGGNFERAWFKGAHLEGSELRGAMLQGADLREAHLEGADLFGVNLKEADLRHAHLQGAVLDRALLENADFRGACLKATRICTDHFMGTNLSGANLEEAIFGTCDLSGAHLSNANLRRADLLGANLAGTWLTDADLQEAGLWGAKLKEAIIWNANFRGAKARSTTTWPDGFDTTAEGVEVQDS